MHIKQKIRELRTDLIVLFILTAISSFSFIYYFHDSRNLPYADSMARLNIARKVVDNLTPGFAQLGSVWLPLPQILMLPMIWNDFLWHSGIAGAVMSMASFVIGGIYLYKIAKLLTNSFVASILTLLIYALNINVMYLQTTALSECLFMCTLSGAVYHLTKWMKQDSWRHLIAAGVWVCSLTLTRYEGLPILLSSIALVGGYTFLRKRKFGKTEGSLFLYCFIACFGWIFWTVYLWAIFRDPLFWMKYYAAPQVTSTGGSHVTQVYTQAKPFMAAVWQYFTSVTWMSGVIPVAFATIGFVLLIIYMIAKRKWWILPIFLPSSIFLFMVLTLQRNTPIIQPNLTLETILSPTTSGGTGFNIRYGLMVFPWVVMLVAPLFGALRKWGINILIFSLFLIQLVSYDHPKYSVIYSIPYRIYSKPYTEVVDYMKKNYDSGPILVSASGFEDQMFEMGFPYKTFIHEGNNKYWKESLDHPARYAAWIILDFNHPADTLGKEFKNKPYWFWFYDLVYDSPNAKIYKIKKKPDLEIPGLVYKEPYRAPLPYVVRESNTLKYGGKNYSFTGITLTDLMYKSDREAERSIKEAASTGVSVVKIWAFGEGIADSFQPTAWRFDSKKYEKLGRMLDMVKANNMKAIITLFNYESQYGGVGQYLRWDGMAGDTVEEKEKFFTSDLTLKRYEAHLVNVLNTKIPSTGKSVREDEGVILGYELINNARASSREGMLSQIGWMSKMAGYVKGMDGKHLIFPGLRNYSSSIPYADADLQKISQMREFDGIVANLELSASNTAMMLSQISDWKKTADSNDKVLILEEQVPIGDGVKDNSEGLLDLGVSGVLKVPIR